METDEMAEADSGGEQDFATRYAAEGEFAL
jgi:hypothetical protein